MRIRGWEWKPRKFGSTVLDRGRPLGEPRPDEDGLFGKQYVTVSNQGSRQFWIVVNDRGDGLPTGLAMRPAQRPRASRLLDEAAHRTAP